MLDNEFPFSIEIMSATIPRDLHFPNFKFYEKSDLLMHIEYSNDMTRVQRLTETQRCRVFPLALEGQACEWYHQLS